jgi:hypothetical protein
VCGTRRGVWYDLKMEYYERQIVWMVENGYTHREVSQYLQQILPFERGLSARSVRRFCAARGVSYRSQVDTPTLDRLIYECVLNVGHTYGRRTLHGLLRSEGINVSQRRIGSSLRTVFPEAHANRSMTLQRHINPIPYSAYYFGEKLHFDQNEKLNMFGVIHVLAIDGYSRKIVGFISIPSKNPILIYHHLYQPILSQYGVWDQLRMDHGTEFNLIISVHRSINRYRNNHCHQPFVQSSSRNNHRAERIWPEINSRINYPIKRVLIQLEATGVIDMSCEFTKFSTSWVALKVVATPVMLFINSWNAHTIPGCWGGIPNHLSQFSRTGYIPPSAIPSTLSAVNSYDGRLTTNASYGKDPLIDHPRLQELRERDFYQVYPSMDQIFRNILHSNGDLFKEAILFFLDLNARYSMLIYDVEN